MSKRGRSQLLKAEPEEHEEHEDEGEAAEDEPAPSKGKRHQSGKKKEIAVCKHCRVEFDAVDVYDGWCEACAMQFTCTDCQVESDGLVPYEYDARAVTPEVLAGLPQLFICPACKDLEAKRRSSCCRRCRGKLDLSSKGDLCNVCTAEHVCTKCEKESDDLAEVKDDYGEVQCVCTECELLLNARSERQVRQGREQARAVIKERDQKREEMRSAHLPDLKPWIVIDLNTIHNTPRPWVVCFDEHYQAVQHYCRQFKQMEQYPTKPMTTEEQVNMEAEMAKSNVYIAISSSV